MSSLKPPEKVVVMFKPRYVNSRPGLVHFAREKFITFYQRIATDLQVESLPLDPQTRKTLEQDFPELLFDASSSRAKGPVTVIGPSLSMARLKESLRKGYSSPSGRSNAGVRHAVAGASGASSSDATQTDPDQICAICMDTIGKTERKTLACKHSFCKACLSKAFEYKPVCPVCGALYGALSGTQPAGGTMRSTKEPGALPGYEKVGRIVIHYHIPSGIQTEEHPSPGQRYEGASRMAYLPDSKQGRRVLELLKRAFDQRLIFTIGQSSTTGRSNVVTWNDIHHKTSSHGGPTGYGYPDPDYLDRVTDELKVKGIQ
ncbi:E3 ubiquitin-protein ligase DTX3L [Aplochiton taeniatus]